MCEEKHCDLTMLLNISFSIQDTEGGRRLSIKATKAPSIKSAKAPSIKITKATKAPSVKSDRRRVL
jgi:hypothetical protein